MSLIFATIPPKRLAQGITSVSTSFYLNNIKSFDGENDVLSANLGTQHYCCFRNDTGTRIELMEIDPTTIGTGPITIVRRGLSFYGDRTTESTDRKLDWTANETIVQLGTDVPQIFQYLKEYVDAAAAAGALGVPASDTAAGIVVRATQAEADAGTAQSTISATPYDNFVRADMIRARNINAYVADAGSTDAYAITPSPAITAYAGGQVFVFKANTINTGACTLNVSGLGAVAIKKPFNTDLTNGDIQAGQIVEVVYDALNSIFQLLSPVNVPIAPVVRVYNPVAVSGDSTTQFDITNPSGTTFRYTWDSTGTDPGITALAFPIGTPVDIQGQNFNAGNKGFFLVTGSGANYFEITNASGVAESNKTLGTGYLLKGATWTKPSGLKYASVEMVGGGGATGWTTSANDNKAGAGGGGYSKKTFATSALGDSEHYVVGYRGLAGTASGQNGTTGARSVFGLAGTFYASGGANGVDDVPGAGGSASGGDINSKGQGGGASGNGSDGEGFSGAGGSSVLGGGGRGAPRTGGDTAGQDGGAYGGGAGGAANGSGGDVNGGSGGDGVIIVTEYY